MEASENVMLITFLFLFLQHLFKTPTNDVQRLFEQRRM